MQRIYRRQRCTNSSQARCRAEERYKSYLTALGENKSENDTRTKKQEAVDKN